MFTTNPHGVLCYSIFRVARLEFRVCSAGNWQRMRLQRRLQRFLCPSFWLLFWPLARKAPRRRASATVPGSMPPQSPQNNEIPRATSQSEPKVFFAQRPAALQRGDLSDSRAHFRNVIAADPQAGTRLRQPRRHRHAPQAMGPRSQPAPKGRAARTPNVRHPPEHRAGEISPRQITPAAIPPLSNPFCAISRFHPGPLSLRTLPAFTPSDYADAVATLEPLWSS